MEELYDSFYIDSQNVLKKEYSRKLLNNIFSSEEKTNFSGLIFDFSKNNDFMTVIFNLGKQIVAVIMIFILFEILKFVFKSATVYETVKFSLSIATLFGIVKSVYEIIVEITEYLNDISLFLGVLSPITGIVLASGGNTATAGANSISFSILFSLVQIILNTVIPCATAFFFGISVLGIISGDNSIYAFSNHVKNVLFSAFSFSVVIYFIVVGYSNSASVNVDTVAAKSFKVLISNAVPIIGSTLSEAAKFAGGGIVMVKNSIGITAAAFVLSMFLPILLLLILINLTFGFLTFLSDFFGVKEMKSLLINLRYATDFTLAASSVIVVTALINIGLFINVMPSVIE